MVGKPGEIVISEDTAVTGDIANCKRIEIYGYVEGRLTADDVFVHKGGKLFGTVKAQNAEVNGMMQGNVSVKHLMNIRSSGEVSGNVQYGQLAMELGGDLSAELRNVPPGIAGDLELSVRRGASVTVTRADLSAIDPDDAPEDLVFTVSLPLYGRVALSDAPGTSITSFTQADLEAGKVVFIHDGSGGDSASFKVVVSDAQGGTSGSPQTVNVAVRG